MSVIKCLMQKAEAGLVSKKTAEKIAAEIGDLQTRSSAGSDVAKELEAAQQAFDIITNRLGQKAKQVAIHADLIKQGAARFKDGVPINAVLKSFSFTDEANAYKHGYLGPAAHERVEYHQRMFTAKAAEVLDKLSPTRMGLFRDPNSQKAIREDLFALLRGSGKRSDNPEIRAVSDAIQALTTSGAEAFERAGGNITQRKDFMLGRSVATDKVLKVDQATYVRDSLEAFDLDLVRNATDGIINTRDDLVRALQKDYQAITSGGLSDLSEFAPKGIKSVVNSRNHHRIFHFKDASAMGTWSEKYGNDSLYQNVVDYAERIGRDVGILETYGPRPEAFIRTMLREAAARDPQAASKYKNKMYTNFKYVTGQWDRSLDPNIAKYMGTYGNLNVAAKLGGTFISAALADTFGLSSVASRMRGLPGLKQIAADFKSFGKPGMKEDIKEWARLGWMSESFINESMASLRASEAEGGHKLSGQLAEGVLKYSALNRKTASAKGAAVRVLGDKLANEEWAAQDYKFKNWAQAHGVTEEVYNIAKKFGTEKVDRWDLDVVSPYKLAEAGYQKEAALIGTLFNRYPEIISPTRSPEFKAHIAEAERSSKGMQVGAGSMKIFTGYLSSFYNNHLRVLASLPGYGDRAKFASATLVSMTMAGTVAEMVSQVIRGEDPTLNETTILKAMGKANFIPLVGDFVFSGGQQFGSGGLGDRVAGTLVSDAGNLGKAGISLLHGDTKNAGRNAQKFVEGLLPGKSLWFASLALRRTVLDQLRYLYDPDAEKYYKRKAAKAEREGQPFWWAPGQVAPSRAPDPTNILEPTPVKKGK